MLLNKMYKKVDVHENNGDDDPIDEAGYLGQFYRKKTNLVPISEADFIQVLSKNNQLAEIIRIIKEIDKQRNGFVTSTELDDILKIVYKNDLYNKDLMPIIKPYASIQNRILIDYKKFRDHIVTEIKKYNKNFTLTGISTTSNSPSKNEKG